MMPHLCKIWPSAIALLLPVPAWAQSPAFTSMSDTAVYALQILVAAAVLLVFAAVVSKLKNSPDWKLGEAVSEEVEFAETDADGKVTKTTRMMASSSRLIALLGMMVILLLFLGVGEVVIWDVAHGKDPDLGGVLNFFLAGASLFVPYAINQVRSGFESIGK